MNKTISRSYMLLRCNLSFKELSNHDSPLLLILCNIYFIFLLTLDLHVLPRIDTNSSGSLISVIFCSSMSRYDLWVSIFQGILSSLKWPSMFVTRGNSFRPCYSEFLNLISDEIIRKSNKLLWYHAGYLMEFLVDMATIWPALSTLKLASEGTVIRFWMQLVV